MIHKGTTYIHNTCTCKSKSWCTERLSILKNAITSTVRGVATRAAAAYQVDAMTSRVPIVMAATCHVQPGQRHNTGAVLLVGLPGTLFY